MRIIAGDFRGMALSGLGKGDDAAHLRPTSDRVRESLFNILGNHGVVEGARVLDLFAGTGALGLEALSRGAVHVTFVDNGRVAQRLIGRNIVKLRVRERTDLVRRDARHLPGRTGAPFDLVFLDPPYRRDMGGAALAAAEAGGWLSANAFIVWEEAHPNRAPAGYSLVDQRQYGDTHITLLSKTSA